MKLIIDGRIVTKNINGIGRYTYELVKRLSKDNDIILLTNNIEMSKQIFNEKNIKYLFVRSAFLSITEIIELPYIVNKYKKEYFYFTPSFSTSPFIKCKSFMTLHDLNHIDLPQYYSKINKYYYKFVVKPFAKKCDKIFTVSNFSNKRIVEWLQCDKEKVVTTYNGIDKNIKKVLDNVKLKGVREKYKLPNRYILYIGNLKPHKNVKTLVKAMSYVNDVKLVINGKPNEELDKLINKNKLNDKIVFIGYVDDEDLSSLYTMAEIFIYPSIYEGFGLPVLEAMSCECPTITSNKTALVEVVEDAAITVDPYDYKNLSNQINNLLIDTKLRDKLIKKGIENSQRFSWDSMADKTYRIMNSNN